jgi:NADPH2 dehydrogenase
MSLLFSPYRIGYVDVKNRVVMPPMCLYQADDTGKVNDFHLTHYGARALGGVGLIIVEATGVEGRGRISDNDLGLWDDAHIEGHQKLVALCHRFGAKMAVQLAHAGRKSVCKASTPVAPSPLAFSNENGYKMPHELSLEEIALIKTHFVHAALRAASAGYDLLELHAAHGYLLCEFLSPLTNRRNDGYGGSLENRCALVLEISHAVLQATGLPLLVRLSADEWMEGGWSVEDSIYLAKELKALGVSMIHVSAGGNHQKQQCIPPIVPLYQAEYAKKIHDGADVQTIAVGLITTAEQGETLLQEDTCELVAYGRELLRNPNFVFFAAKALDEKQFIEPSYTRAF